MGGLLHPANKVQTTRNNILRPSSLIEFIRQSKPEITHRHFCVASVQSHTHGQTPCSHFCFLDRLLTRLGAPETGYTSCCKAGAVMVEKSALDNCCAVSQLAKSDFYGDNILFQDLYLVSKIWIRS